MGNEPSALRAFLRDDHGRLRQIAGRSRDARGVIWQRQSAFLSRTPRFLHLERPERGVALLPLVCRGEALGLLEVVGPPASVLRAWGTLESISSQFAIALSHLDQRGGIQQELSMMERITDLTQELVRVNHPEDALRAVMDACHRWGYRSAAWVSNGQPNELRFLGVRGLGSDGRRRLRSAMGVIAREELSGAPGRKRVARRFSDAVGAKGIELIAPGDAVLILADVPKSARPALKILEALLADVLAHVEVVSLAETRNQNLDLSLAWTAHEIRRPLVSLRLFVERLLESNQDEEERRWLSMSLQELGRLIDLIEDVLRWSVVQDDRRDDEVDIVAVIEEQARARDVPQRVSIEASGPMIVPGDGTQLAAVMRNLIDNALSYSPEKVEIFVDRTKKDVLVSIKDRGPGISQQERRYIFDPFVRGEMGRLIRNGTGLGLYIARRVTEAHGGQIWLESNGRGATFKVRLPAAKR